MSERPRRPSYDLFVSYDPRDAAFVEDLSRRVGAEGFTVWLDAWELVPGAPAASVVERAVAESAVFAACVGAHTSNRLDAELALARGAAAETRPASVVVILLPGGSVPPALAERPVVDMREGISREAMNRLAELISTARKAAPSPASTDGGPATAKDYRRLLEHLDQVLAEDPSNVEAIRAQAGAAVALGRQEEALAALDRLAVLAPDDLMLITMRIPLLVSMGRSDEVPALLISADASADRIVAQIASAFEGKSDAEVTRDIVAFTTLANLTDRYSAGRLVEAVRTDRARAAKILRAEFASLAGTGLAQVGDAEGALSAWRRAVGLDPERTGYRFKLAKALADAGQPDALDRELAAWAAEQIPTVARFARAWSALRAGRADEALTHLNAAIELDPADPMLRAARAELLIATRRVAEGADDLRAVWQNNPSNSQLLSVLLSLYRSLERADDEAELLDAWADNAEPLSRGLLRTAAKAPAGETVLQRNIERLLATGEMAAQIHARADGLRIHARLSDGREAEALRLARRSVSRWPRQYASWSAAMDALRRTQDSHPADAAGEPGEPAWVEKVWQATAALARDDAEGGSRLLQQVVHDTPDVGVLHWLQGAILDIAGDRQGAVAAFTRAIGLDRDAPAPLFFRADALQRLGRLEEALADLDVALDELQAGTERDAYFRRGEIRRLLERYRPAIEDFDRALTIPERGPAIEPMIIGSRGQARLALGDVEGALKDLTDALEKKPDMAWALISRSTAHLARHDVEGAIADRRRIVELRPTDTDAWAAYAMMLLETGQPEVLWNELSEAVRANPALPTPAAHNLLARAAIAMGRFADAEHHFRTAAELEPDEDFWKYEEARAMRHLGRMEDARARVEQALAQQVVPSTDDPSYIPIRSNRCLYLLAVGRHEEAEQEWQQLLRRVEAPALLRTELEELAALAASGHESPALQRVRNSIQARLEELTSALAG